MDFLNLTSLNPPTKTPFLAHFVAESDLLADLGDVSHLHTSLATGLLKIPRMTCSGWFIHVLVSRYL